MPESKKLSVMNKIPYSWWVAIAMCILLLIGLVWWFVGNKKTSSIWAVLDGNIYTVNSEFSGIIESIMVNEGDMVVSRQPMGRLASVNARHMDLSRQDLSSFRPPDLAEMEARIKQAEEAEKNIVVRIANARKDEEAKKRIFEQAANDHAKAQYQRRSLDSQMVLHSSSGQYQSAQKLESESFSNKEKCREEFELASRTRAALDQELGRIRDEINRAKQIVSQNRYSMPGKRLVPNSTQPADITSTIYATTSGKVVRCNVKPGQEIEQGEPIFLIAPDNKMSEKQPLWVQAYFSMADADKIKHGQSCEIIFEQSGIKAQGKVGYINSPQPLPSDAKKQLQENLSSDFLPVRISLDAKSDQTPDIGSIVKCTIKSGLF